MLFTLRAGDMGEMGGDAALNGANCHGKNGGCGYIFDSNAAAVWLAAKSCGVSMPIDESPEYKLAGSDKPFCRLPPTNDRGDSDDDLLISSCSCFILAKMFAWYARAASIILWKKRKEKNKQHLKSIAIARNKYISIELEYRNVECSAKKARKKIDRIKPVF